MIEVALDTFSCSQRMSTKSRVTQAYIAKVAHANGVKITKEAKAAYAKLPDKQAVDDMLTHASQLVRSVGKKTISGKMAAVEMHHYTSGDKH